MGSTPRARRRWAIVPIVLIAWFGQAPPAALAAGHHPARPPAEIFATNNTAIITDPGDPRLRTRLVRFDHRVRRIIRQGGAVAGRSTLLDGVFWSGSLGQTTHERSRDFDVYRTDTVELHHIADLIRKEFHQESVLTFQRLGRTDPRTDAIRVEVPGVDVRELHDALVADPEARERLGGGSVTIRGRLILIAEQADVALVRRFVTGRLGGDWSAATIGYGDREFVG